jgi:surface antigen
MLKTKEFIMLKKTVVITMSCLMLGSCAGMSLNKEMVGATIGAGAGGAACSRVGKGYGNTAAIIGCSLVGAMVGGTVGRSIDETDRMKTQQAIMQTPTNQTTSWYNPNNGNQYAVTPVNNPMQYNNGTVCRDFTTIATIDGHRENIRGRACRQPDGSWQMQ